MNMTKQEIVNELTKIAKKSGGLLKPEKVVDAARSVTSPLHKQFCWDETKAAEEYRLYQARQLIVSVNVTYSNNGRKIKVQKYVSLRSDRIKGGYREYAVVMSNPTQREELLKDAYKDLMTFQEKYQSLTELSKIFKEIKKIEIKLKA